MSYDRIAELERQTAVALAALGTSISQALVESGEACGVLNTLQTRARSLEVALRESHIDPAATMFGAFVEALCDASADRPQPPRPGQG